MTGATWFTLSIGRRNRAEPRWVLPLICKAGGITRDDVGSIKIHDDHTRFEIVADKAEAFATRIASEGSGEKGVTISPAGAVPAEAPRERTPREDRPPRAEKAYGKPHEYKKASSAEDGFQKKSGKKPGKYKPKDRAPHKGKPKRSG